MYNRERTDADRECECWGEFVKSSSCISTTALVLSSGSTGVRKRRRTLDEKEVVDGVIMAMDKICSESCRRQVFKSYGQVVVGREEPGMGMS